MSDKQKNEEASSGRSATAACEYPQFVALLWHPPPVFGSGREARNSRSTGSTDQGATAASVSGPASTVAVGLARGQLASTR